MSVSVLSSQDDFNKAVSSAVHSLYLLSLKTDLEKEHDIEVRDRMAEIDAFAFRAEYAAMPPPNVPDPAYFAD